MRSSLKAPVTRGALAAATVVALSVTSAAAAWAGAGASAALPGRAGLRPARLAAGPRVRLGRVPAVRDVDARTGNEQRFLPDGTATAQAAATLGWRIAAVRHYGAAHDASGFSAVITPGRKTAWAFGGSNPGGVSLPVAMQWNGQRWHSWALPRGLTGFISDASAPAGDDIWAVSYAGGYVVHWNGTRWSVARRWSQHTPITGVTALSPTDVWVFGTTTAGLSGMGTWHFNGQSWARVSGPASEIYRASAVSRHDIWAVAANRKGGFIEHYNGRRWRAVRTGQAIGRTRLDDVLAVSRSSVWVVGNLQDRQGDGRLILAHFNGRDWTRISTPWHADTGRLAPAPDGGVWVTADNTGASDTALIGHLCPGCHASWAVVKWGEGSGISDIAVSRRTGTVWLSGGFLTRTGGDAAVWCRRFRHSRADQDDQADDVRIGGPLTRGARRM
jgi:hypothetical protein